MSLPPAVQQQQLGKRCLFCHATPLPFVLVVVVLSPPRGPHHSPKPSMPPALSCGCPSPPPDGRASPGEQNAGKSSTDVACAWLGSVCGQGHGDERQLCLSCWCPTVMSPYVTQLWLRAPTLSQTHPPLTPAWARPPHWAPQATAPTLLPAYLTSAPLRWPWRRGFRH